MNYSAFNCQDTFGDTFTHFNLKTGSWQYFTSYVSVFFFLMFPKESHCHFFPPASLWFQDAGTAQEGCQNHTRLRAPIYGLTSHNEGWPGGENEQGRNWRLSSQCVCVHVCALVWCWAIKGGEGWCEGEALYLFQVFGFLSLTALSPLHSAFDCFTKVVSTNKDRLSLDNHFYWMEKRNKMKMFCVNFIITCMYLLLSAVSSEVNAS